MTEVNQTSPRGATGRPPKRRRSELERLLDRTVLGPTHPELGSCWQFTGTCTPYGRMAKAQDSYTHRLGWKLLRGPIPEDRELHHRCGVYACWNPDHLQIVLPMRKIWPSSARRIASTGIHCRARTSGSTRGQARESAGHASVRANGSSGREHAPGQPGRPPGRPRMELHHRCGIHACWNPDHLMIVTHAENMAFRRNTAKSRCGRGHALSNENLRVGPNGQRICRACNAENQRAFRSRQAATKRPSR